MLNNNANAQTNYPAHLCTPSLFKPNQDNANMLISSATALSCFFPDDFVHLEHPRSNANSRSQRTTRTREHSISSSGKSLNGSTSP